MDVGIGLPNAIPGLEGGTVAQWARRSEQAGFSSLGTIDRLNYPNYESLVALSAAAAVTERIRLATTVLLAPLRISTPLFAKQAATLDNISGGRLRLGLAVGPREDDYRALGLDFVSRGEIFDEQLAELRALWDERGGDALDRFGPRPFREGGPELMIGGSVGASFRRAARYASGWIMGGGTPDQLREGRGAAERAWQEEGRSGRPRIAALAYYVLGSGTPRRPPTATSTTTTDGSARSPTRSPPAWRPTRRL